MWVDVSINTDYRINIFGDIVNKRTGKVRKQQDSGGYRKVTIRVNKKKRSIFVHRLLAVAFIPNPGNKPCVNHINGIRSDNRLSNLEWVTHGENTRHAFMNGQIKPTWTGKFGRQHCRSKNVGQYTEDGVLVREWGSVREAGRGMGCSFVAISQCARGEIKTSKGYVWKFI